MIVMTPMTLGSLIEKLKEFDPSWMVEGTTGFFESYRGFNDHLALEPFPRAFVSVENVLQQAEAAVGTKFKGYKSGRFLMTVNTPIWVAKYGKSNGQRLLNLKTKNLVMRRVELVVLNCGY